MRYMLVSAAAVMAITGAAAIGNAQMDEKGKGPGTQAPGSSTQGAPSGERSQQPGRSEQGSGGERQPGQMERRGTAEQAPRAGQEPQGRDRSKSATQPQREGEKQKATEQRQRDQDQRKATEQRQRDQDRQKTTGRDQDRDQQKTTQGRDQQQGRVQVSEEKRSGVRERLVKESRVERVDRSRINVNINVGARLPRTVRLHTLPVQIVSFAPAYRGYSYILLEDETICIVDPRTYVIVDVIPAGSQRADRPGRAHLTLSADDMRFIYRTVPKERTADVRIRLALGAEVPRDVELLDFPPEVIERVPEVRRYRYIVADRDVVIVDPSGYEVALVIND